MAILSEVSKVHSGTKEWTLYKLLDNQSADETESDAIDITNADLVTLFVESGVGVSNGVVKLETAVQEDGPYFVAGTVTVNAASSAFADSIGGGDVGLPARYARARIETAITGGTVDVYIVVQR